MSTTLAKLEKLERMNFQAWSRSVRHVQELRQAVNLAPEPDRKEKRGLLEMAIAAEGREFEAWRMVIELLDHHEQANLDGRRAG